MISFQNTIDALRDADNLLCLLGQPKNCVARMSISRALLEIEEAKPGETATCERCQGNGEIVANWDKYLHPENLAEEETSVAECPDCDGEGVSRSSSTCGAPSPHIRR